MSTDPHFDGDSFDDLDGFIDTEGFADTDDLYCSLGRREHRDRPAPEPIGDSSDGSEVFRVPVGPAGGLEAIVAALTRRLAALATPTHTAAVFLSPQDRPGRFTQCLVDVENGAWVECVSNNYLADHDQLDPDREQMLVDLGFLTPDDDHPNFWLIHDQPVPWSEVAHLMAAPFATVFPVHEHAVMELTVNRHFRERDEAESWEESQEEQLDESQDGV